MEPYAQGTAAVALAGLYGAMKVSGKPPSAIADQRFVVLGAGSAGMGVVRMLAAGGQPKRAKHACKVRGSVAWCMCVQHGR